MNIRDPHSKFGFRPEARFTRDDYAVHRPPAVNEEKDEAGPTFSAPSGAALRALATTDPPQFAGVMNAIASELRAAADGSEGPQSGFLDALATQFESAARSMPPARATTAPTEGALTELATQGMVPQGMVPQGMVPQGYHGHHGHPGGSGDRNTEQLLERILDALSAALTQET